MYNIKLILRLKPSQQVISPQAKGKWFREHPKMCCHPLIKIERIKELRRLSGKETGT
jgi:hypothetical protein